MTEVEPHPAWKQIEQAALIDDGRLPSYAPGEHSIELSKAISLKRIADAIAPTEGRSMIDNLNEVLTDFTNNLYSTLLNARQ